MTFDPRALVAAKLGLPPNHAALTYTVVHEVLASLIYAAQERRVLEAEKHSTGGTAP